MTHDATHCSDYRKGECPESCYRARLTEDYYKRREEFIGIPISWSAFKDSIECSKEKFGAVPLVQSVKVTIDLDRTRGVYVIKHGEEIPIEEYIRGLVKEAMG